MTINTTMLTRAAGLCAVVAGLLFIGVQINHPHLDVAFVTKGCSPFPPASPWSASATRCGVSSAPQPRSP